MQCLLTVNVCDQCGRQTNMEERKKKGIDRDKLITEYFCRSYPFKAIVSFLEKFHDVHIHQRTLKRRLRELGLKRKKEIMTKKPCERWLNKRCREPVCFLDIAIFGILSD